MNSKENSTLHCSYSISWSSYMISSAGVHMQEILASKNRFLALSRTYPNLKYKLSYNLLNYMLRRIQYYKSPTKSYKKHQASGSLLA